MESMGLPQSLAAQGSPLRAACAPNSSERSEMVQARWSTPIEGWKTAGDRRVPLGGKAVWHFSSGDFAYADFRSDDSELVFNVAPGSVTRPN